MAKIRGQFTRRSQGLFESFEETVVCLVLFWSDNVIVTRGLGRQVKWIENDWHRDV